MSMLPACLFENKMWPLKYIVNAIVMFSSKKHTIIHFNISYDHLLKSKALYEVHAYGLANVIQCELVVIDMTSS